MKPNFKHLWIFLTILAITALSCKAASPAVEPVTPPTNNGSTDTPTTEPGELSAANRARLISATVQIFGLFEQNGELVPGYVGSGTILTSTGMILTNAHVASPASQGDVESEPDALSVSIIVSEDRPAVPSYLATVKAVDGFLDLAVIQITSTINGTTVDPNSLNLPYVEIGNSDNMHVGDKMNIFGFPLIGGDTITYTQGTVSGFSSEDQIGDRAWIKTDTTISGGNSGGLAADNNGSIIGVPTIAAASRDTETSDCRQVQDTNGDGVLDEKDSCIPIGGFLNGIRPVNLAQPLIQAAQSGRAYTSPFGIPGVVSQSGSGSESATNFVWLDTTGSTADKCDWSNDAVSSYPDSALCLAAGFEYAGMTDGEVMVEYWYKDGEKVSEYSYAWEWGDSGLFGTYLPNEGNPLPAGSYRVEFYAGDNLTPLGSTAEIQVGSGGGGNFNTPQQSGDTITVSGIVYDASTDKPIRDAYVFVLTPGTTYDEWQNADFADKYVITYLQTGSDGSYRITDIPRNTEFTMVFSAEGYYDASADNMVVGDNDPATYEMNVGLNK
ncbi:MAG TPA: trypsin-like peptidase domain-containing protein [Anaerolineales bacterium]|nr:trypsin-like peptidase domain-containing protein [Anaerolineales bacterium]HNN12078.1 trypsin-like peptidase domain-containing protein [Anaerolineales bacterium]HNO31676.1 trypsin-like peptidase domain-containing protein [Anaerolineales bacterium]